MHAALAGPLLAALLATARARPQPPDGGQCRPPGSQRDLNSFLWTVRRDPPAYLFGTIHVPYTRVWDFIPDNSKAAFQASARVYFELDLTDPYTISALASCQLLPHGENLQDVLPRELYWRLKRHLDYVKLMMPSWMTPAQRGKGLYADYLFNAIAGNWERKRPVWVMLMVNSLTETDVRSRGVPVLDLYLAQQAEKMKKTTGAVERVEEQCHPLNGLNFSQVLFALNQTLLQHESVRAGSLQAPYTTEDLIKHYNCGDLNAVIFNHDTSQLPNFINTTLPPHEQVTAQEIDSYFRQELIYKRNERMGKRVMTLLQENEDKICFFAFGAGHFLGNNTVIDVLRQAGLEVEHTPAGQTIHSPIAGSPAPPPEGTSASPAPVTPAAAMPAAPSVPPTAPPEEEDPALSPHLLLPDSLSQLEEFGRQKKWHKRQNKHQRPRQFNDLWHHSLTTPTALPDHAQHRDRQAPLPALRPTPAAGRASTRQQLSTRPLPVRPGPAPRHCCQHSSLLPAAHPWTLLTSAACLPGAEKEARETDGKVCSRTHCPCHPPGVLDTSWAVQMGSVKTLELYCT
ncbi:metalloprotease TIKI2 isoform X1 [Moschus berezovskii]|uniref:metalloprotease TIKI2 isoform X1 n=1 Tax=Moschus berezovskii TaxID=68408 RepID=UPI002444DAB5|nr:metalloprotease TIKI2 isoform X1 [Moschus berezovskii]